VVQWLHEAFDDRLWAECLNIISLYSLLPARVVMGDWKSEDNHDRWHSSLDYFAPADCARQCNHTVETDDPHKVRA
jgi:hypothetical protein